MKPNEDDESRLIMEVDQPTLEVYAEVTPPKESNQCLCLGQLTDHFGEEHSRCDSRNTASYLDPGPSNSDSYELLATASDQTGLNYSYDDCYNFSRKIDLLESKAFMSLSTQSHGSQHENPYANSDDQRGALLQSFSHLTLTCKAADEHAGSEVQRSQGRYGTLSNQQTVVTNPDPNITQTFLASRVQECRERNVQANEGITSSPLYVGPGIAAYIANDEDIASTPTRSDKAPTRPKSRQRKQPEPWYRVSRPIHEQTKDLKIRSINRSTSIHFSRLLEKCRSIVEYCTRRDDVEEMNENNLKLMNHNHQWGDPLPSGVKGNTIRVAYQNVHRSLSASDNPHTNSLLDNLNNMEVDIFMASETNVNWKSAKCRNDFKHKVSRIWPSNRIAYSSSDVGLQFALHEFLPGGTCTMAVDNLSMRVVKAGEDPSGLGRWSYITIEGQGGRKITFITAYRVCKGAVKGASTACKQQSKVINEQEMKKGVKASTIDTTYLREKFVEDLILFIQSLKEDGHAIVLGMDANETPGESCNKEGVPKQGSISWLLEKTELREVFDARHQILPDSSTTSPGRYIDRLAVYGINIERVTLLRANEPAKSDHLGMVVDLDLKFLFNNACSPLAYPQPRKLTSGNADAVQKYITFIQKQFIEHRIVERCRRLREISETENFEEHHRLQLYSLDWQITEILLGAENQCSKKRVQKNLWSPALAKAGKEIGYWKQRISSNGNVDDGTREIGVSLGLPGTIQQPMSLELCRFYYGVAWKSYRGIQAQERAYRDKFLKEKASELAKKGDGDVAKAVKQIRQREKLRGDYASIRRGYGIQKQGLATLDTPDSITGGRKLITQADEIHAYLLQRNKTHFSQATFTTFGDAGPGFKYIDPANPESDTHIDEMLEGVFEPWDSASQNVREFLRELRCTITKELDTKLCFEDFKQLFKTIPENTASSVSGLHYGHYKVLSKMQDDTIIRVLFDLVNIAFTTQSPLPRWKHATQLMLEKGKGPAIENLRIIQLLEADMSWLLRYLWGRKLDRHALHEGVYNEAQFASPGKLCQSAILNKVLFFDLLRQTRQYGALIDNDATAAFDRVLPALCVVTCRQLGMPKEAQRFFFKLLRQMEYTTTTAHGRSKETYSAMENPKVPSQGVMQGGGASLPNYKSQQLPVLNAFERNCTPAVFRPASKLKASFTRWVSGFSDDIGLFLNELGVRLSGLDANLPIAQRLRNTVLRNLSKYEEYFFTAGGALNLKKSFYYLVGFRWVDTEWRYCTNAEINVDPILITPTTLDNSGQPQTVQWCEADDAQRTLGSFIAPNGSFNRQLDVLRGKLVEWKQCLGNLSQANLQAKWLSYKTVFLRKVMYPLIGHSCASEDLHALQQPVDREILHILGLNEHFPRAVLYAPLKYGGLGCTTIHGQHVIDKVLLFVHHMREGGKMREALMGSMSITQLECGTSRPFFDLPAMPWTNLVTQTWVTHIWKECQPLGIALKFYNGDFWVPKPVREGDACIMDIASTIYSGDQLCQINLCRIFLKVTYLSDITSVDGRRILLGYYNGNDHRASGRRTRLNWPPVGDLPQRCWNLWRTFLTSWCGSDLRLPQPLGRWYADAEMLTQCCFFLHGRRLIMQQNEDFYEFSPVNTRARTRFCTQANPLSELSLLETAKVVDIAYRHQCIYVISQSDQLVIPAASAPQVRSLQDLYEALSPELQRTIGNVIWPDVPDLIDIVQSVQEGTTLGVSDGSVRVRESKATHAWILQAANGSEIRGHGPVDGDIEPRTIHRAELQGQTALFLMLALIVRYAGIIGGTLATYCDNKAVVKKLQHGWKLWRYRNTKGADSDLQAQLRDVLRDLENKDEIGYNTQWVKGHQDELQNIRSLPRQVLLNVRMDADTKVAYDLPAHWQTQSFVPVLKAEGCAVYIEGKKITSSIHFTLQERWHEEEARKYLSQRHNFTTETFTTISWQSMHYALAKFSTHRRALAIKAIHRHLPTHDKLFKQGRVVMSSLCSCCMRSEETNSHVLCCPNEEAVKHRKEAWFELWKALGKQRTANVIERTWRHYLQPYLGLPEGTTMVERLPSARGELADLLQLAVDEQTRIGWEKLLVGLGASSWKTLQDFIDTSNPKPPQRTAMVWMNVAMFQLIKFSIRCWKKRNLMVHGSTQQEQRRIALERVRERIKLVYEKPPMLAPQFRSIYEVPLEHRLKMPLQSAEQWLAMITHQAKVTAHNLRILMMQHQTMHSHLRTMRRMARNQAKERKQPETPRKARRRVVQAANIAMREKLYAKKAARETRGAIHSRSSGRVTRMEDALTRQSSCRRASAGGNPKLRHHPP